MESETIQLELSNEMIERVLREWETRNPGKDVKNMPADEFAATLTRMIFSTARVLPRGHA